jgi:glycine/D-amino acid oxidase-like deaminating enzyme/nitrite reductase/ring-hydroxylating ferredoxin subunit
MLTHTSTKVAGAYLEANREAQSWLLDYCAARGLSVQQRDAYTYAATASGLSSVKKEFKAARDLGLDVQRAETDELPYATQGAIRLADQAQFDPVEALQALAGDLRELGGILVEGVRVRGVEVGDPCSLDTSAGQVRADQVVLATGIPILDRGLYFAKLTPQRSYAAAFRVPGPRPQGMYLSADTPTRSLRTAIGPHGEELLLVGGNGHVVGRHPSPQQAVNDLVDWTKQNFPGAELSHRWSAQDYKSHNLVPFVGVLPRGGGKVWVGTGYNKWGMTNAVAAALRISGEILGDQPRWGKVLGRRITRPADVLTSAHANASVGVAAALGWIRATRAQPVDELATPTEGAAVTGRRGRQPVGISSVDGSRCAVSLVCPHMKGVLNWNDAEKTWDCPLHGSRFTAQGKRLEGPATEDLERIDQT